MDARINDLLEKYWEGETTVEEENILKSYFQNGQVMPEHEAFTPLFVYFNEQKKLLYSLPPVEDIIQKSNISTPVITLTSYKKWMYAIASVFCLVIASWFLFKPSNESLSSTAYVNEIEDPEEAYRVTMEALAMVSGKLQKGTEGITIGMENVNKANIFK
ncbi:MAG: hypothetical protein IPF52_04535 [Saprospiraceae bacterium]|nr:hypothetical protein [Saprospiraceae bacterium]MBK7524314.1 hypothetical protein [Saprospiraceae bacterium]MBK8855482.1 hypothetical protein [Saprospiraceae bacterium]MBK9043669.1 hypothetical protein [Saprospiraceae bacterium]MBP6694247.1 hypothetical protein [Saprospiraceae bacterium]